MLWENGESVKYLHVVKCCGLVMSCWTVSWRGFCDILPRHLRDWSKLRKIDKGCDSAWLRTR